MSHARQRVRDIAAKQAVGAEPARIAESVDEFFKQFVVIVHQPMGDVIINLRLQSKMLSRHNAKISMYKQKLVSSGHDMSKLDSIIERLGHRNEELHVSKANSFWLSMNEPLKYISENLGPETTITEKVHVEALDMCSSRDVLSVCSPDVALIVFSDDDVKSEIQAAMTNLTNLKDAVADFIEHWDMSTSKKHELSVYNPRFVALWKALSFFCPYGQSSRFYGARAHFQFTYKFMDYVKDQALHIVTETGKEEAWYFKFLACHANKKTVTLPATKVNAGC